MRLVRVCKILLLACLLLGSLHPASQAAEKQKYYFMVFSNPVKGKEAEYNQWYDTQHIYDLLHIEGFVAAQRFELSDVQLGPRGKTLTPAEYTARHPARYLIIWEIETDDLPGVFERVHKGLDSGTTVSSPAFDGGPTYVNHTFVQLTKRFTAADLPQLSAELGKK